MALNVFGLITRIRDVTTYPFGVYASKQHVRMSNSTARLDPRQFSLYSLTHVPVPAMASIRLGVILRFDAFRYGSRQSFPFFFFSCDTRLLVATCNYFFFTQVQFERLSAVTV